MSAERRLYSRLMVCVPCRLYHDGQQIRGSSYDLSERGASVITETELNREQSYDLEVCWIQGEPSHLRGAVRYCRKLKDGSYLSGFHFDTEITATGKDILRSLRSDSPVSN